MFSQLDQVYDPNAPEDDMNERYEEMNRMREHVMNELDKDKDKLVSKEEFLQYTASNDFNKDEPWDVSNYIVQADRYKQLPTMFNQTKFDHTRKKDSFIYLGNNSHFNTQFQLYFSNSFQAQLK